MSDKTEQATAHSKQKARERGDRVRSRELLSGLGTLAGVLTMGAVAPGFVSAWRQTFARSMSIAAQAVDGRWDIRTAARLIRWALLPAAIPFVGVLGACFVAVISAGILQGGGLHLSVHGLKPSVNRLNPLTNLKNLFSLRSVARLAKSLLPAFVVLVFGYNALRGSIIPRPVLSLDRMPMTFAVGYGLAVKAAWVTVAWAALDYVVELRSWNQRLKMSKQDIREEHKEQGGNPQVKGKIKQLQRAMRRRKAKADMRRASVVITNPTHYAVALEFDMDTMSAPTVLTKGRDLHALDIREEARWAGIPIIENPPLARSLYRAVEPGQAIPFELYAAVAGILAFLFKQANEEKARQSAQAAAQRSPQRAASSSAPLHSFQNFQGGM